MLLMDAYGGVFLEEHPGIPFHDYQPSIWRSDRSAIVILWNSLDNTQIFDCIRVGTGALRRLQICMLLLIHLLGNLTRSQSALILAVPSAPVCTKSIHLGCRRVLPLPSPNS